jgi:hypothetical protein
LVSGFNDIFFGFPSLISTGTFPRTARLAAGSAPGLVKHGDRKNTVMSQGLLRADDFDDFQTPIFFVHMVF